MIKMTIISVGSRTTNGNNVVKMRYSVDEEVQTMFGLQDRKSQATYYVAVKDGTANVEVDQEIDVDLDAFKISHSKWVEEDGSLPKDEEGEDICDNNGNPIVLKWLNPKGENQE